MTSLESERRSTWAVISDGVGAAVSAATCAGDLICCAATQPPPAKNTTAVSARITTWMFLRDFISLVLGRRAVGSDPVERPDLDRGDAARRVVAGHRVDHVALEIDRSRRRE